MENRTPADRRTVENQSNITAGPFPACGYVTGAIGRSRRALPKEKAVRMDISRTVNNAGLNLHAAPPMRGRFFALPAGKNAALSARKCLEQAISREFREKGPLGRVTLPL
jgi:hypothetical protein